MVLKCKSLDFCLQCLKQIFERTDISLKCPCFSLCCVKNSKNQTQWCRNLSNYKTSNSVKRNVTEMSCRNLNWELKFSSLIDSKYLACTYFHKSLYTLESQLIALILQRWGYIQVIQWLRWKSSHQICYSLRAKRIVGHRQL